MAGMVKLLKNFMVKKLLLLIVAIILWRQIVPLWQLVMNFRLNDFSVYLDGTKSALKGINPYQLRFFDRFNYSPAATLFFIPLTLIPENTAELIFTAISILSLLLSIKIIFELLKIKIPFPLFLLVFALALKTYPSKLTLVLGQINLIILALIMGSYYFRAKPFEALSGIFLSLATIFKLTPAPLIIYFLFRKKWKTVLWFTITVAFLTLLGIFVFGWDLTYYYYFKTIPQLMNENTPATLNGTYMNQSITALLGKFGIFGGLNSVIRLGISLGLAIKIINIIKVIKTKEKIQEFILFWNLVVIIMLFLPVFVWQHHYTILIPIWIILTAKFIKTKNIKDLAISGLTYFLLIFYIKDPYLPGQLNPFLSGHFLTTATIFLILSSYAMDFDQKQISGGK